MGAAIKFVHKGSFSNAERFFNKALRKNYRNVLEKYGAMGVAALAAATPEKSGKTAASWDYGIEEGDGYVSLYWTNSHENKGVNIALLLIYGHGLRNGGYVQGNDFVTPALQPIFDQMANVCWKEVVT